MALAVAFSGCGSEPSDEVGSDRSLQLDQDDAVGSCRSELADREAAGSASVAWVSLSTALVNAHIDRSAVIRAARVEDAGERRMFDEHETELIDQPRAVRFSGVEVLDGTFDPQAEVVMNAWAAYDATGITADGGYVIAVVATDEGGRLLAGPVVGIDDGDVLFPGDCHPAWREAFADYARQQGRLASELVEDLLVDPGSPAAEAFSASDHGRTGGGPSGRSGR